MYFSLRCALTGLHLGSRGDFREEIATETNTRPRSRNLAGSVSMSVRDLGLLIFCMRFLE